MHYNINDHFISTFTLTSSLKQPLRIQRKGYQTYSRFNNVLMVAVSNACKTPGDRDSTHQVRHIRWHYVPNSSTESADANGRVADNRWEEFSRVEVDSCKCSRCADLTDKGKWYYSPLQIYNIHTRGSIESQTWGNICNIYTPSFSSTMNIKNWHPFFHETVSLTYEPVVPVAVLNTALLCIKQGYFIAKPGQF